MARKLNGDNICATEFIDTIDMILDPSRSNTFKEFGWDSCCDYCLAFNDPIAWAFHYECVDGLKQHFYIDESDLYALVKELQKKKHPSRILKSKSYQTMEWARPKLPDGNSLRECTQRVPNGLKELVMEKMGHNSMCDSDVLEADFHLPNQRSEFADGEVWLKWTNLSSLVLFIRSSGTSAVELEIKL